MPSARVFPFEPKTTTHVWPADFWAIPTRRGGWYCCGRVLATTASSSTGRTALVVGLMDWCEPHPPTPETLAGALVADYGAAHVKTIRETGGQLLGHRPLELDSGLQAFLAGWPMHDDLGVWGYKEIENRAHSLFGRHFPDSPAVATERPTPLLRRWDERE